MKFIAAVTAGVLALSGCAKPVIPPTNPPTPDPSVSVSVDPEVTVLSTRAGSNGIQYITDGQGRPVYVYGSDRGSEISRCAPHECPSQYTKIIAGDRVDVTNSLQEGEVGVGGEGQVMYNGYLLYYYNNDTNESPPQGVSPSFYLINAQGNPLGIA